MSQTLVVSNHVYDRLARGAAERGMTVQSLLRFVTDVVVPRIPPTNQDRRRGRRIEQLFAKYRAAPLNDEERAELDHLIDEEYKIAIERADARIAVKEAAKRNRATSKSLRRSRRRNGTTAT